jgi:hypothetical protein
LYARCALGLRPDVEEIAPHLLSNEWYPEQVSARLGIPIVRGQRLPGGGEPTLSSRDLLDQLVATKRPVFVTGWFATGSEKTTPSYPIGPLIRVVFAWSDVPDPDSLAAMNEEAFAKLALEPTLPSPTTWAGRRMLDYARPWNALAHAFAASGDAARAESYRHRARALTPR